MAADEPTFDLLVVGAGVMGSATAAAAALAGRRVALLEAAVFGHEAGSSHGENRIVRRTYPLPLYTALMSRVYPLWAALEDAAGEAIYTRTGGLDIAQGAALEGLLTACRAAGVAVDVLTPAEALARFGLRLDEDQAAVYQEDTGVLRAAAGVAAMQRVATERGARLYERFRVTELRDLEAEGGNVEAVALDGRVVRARAAVVAAGPWAGPLLRAIAGMELPLSVVQVAYAYYRAAPGVADDAALDCLPVFIDYGSGVVPWSSTPAAGPAGGLPCVYSCPSTRRDEHGRRLVKVGLHGGIATTAEDAPMLRTPPP